MATLQKIVILKDRIELYLDFSMNLLYYISEYYLDKASLSSDSDISNHYSWCYNKACNDFKEENIDFSQNSKLKKYFYDYYYAHLYVTDKFDGKEELPLKDYMTFFNTLFEVNKGNSRYMNILIELYLIFEESINK